jgi:NUMOD4 motif/HNH endonuclease
MPKCNISTSALGVASPGLSRPGELRSFSLPGELWKPVVGYEKSYAVSTSGRVVFLRTGKLLEPQLHYKDRYSDSPSEKYLTVLLFKDIGTWSGRRCAVHNLVLTAFRGPQPPGQACRHLDGDNLNNALKNLVWGARPKKLGSVREAPTLDEFKRVLRYDPNTGAFYWRVRPRGKAHSIRPGDTAGVPSRNGYVQIYYAGKMYNANQLAWWFMTGGWPPRSLVVEHFNASKVDNRWSNLFAVSHVKNTQNPNDKLRTDNRSGYRGVFLLHTGKWHAYITVDGYAIALGNHADFEQAVAARKAAERLYFTPGHSEALDFKLRAVLGENYKLHRIPRVCERVLAARSSGQSGM